jgi:two-component system NtrC family response regulator
MVGQSPALLKILDISARVASRRTPILIVGESGTGKDLLARAIHENSGARTGPLVKFTCGLLRPDAVQLMFSSVRSDAPGTLYLDDVTELSPDLQADLAQLLHEAENAEMGSSSEPRVRIISSTSRTGNLVKEGRLRPDLYYYLSVIPLHLPPLRERKEDLAELARYFADRLAKRHNLPATPISATVYDRFADYDWPGNIRELENVVERMMLFAADFEFSGQGLATEASRATGQTGSQFLGGLPESGVSLAQIERDLLVAALAKFGGNQTKAARYLNISRRTLIYRMGKFNLRPAVNSEDR